MNTSNTGSLISQCRKEKKLTQQQLADQIGVTNKAVSKWETGQGMPDVSLLPDLSRLLGITMDELLNGKRNYIEETMNTSKEIKQPTYNSKDTASYERFKAIASFPALFAVIGMVIPYFIWLETHDYTGLLFGCWFEFCSALIFFYLYRIFSRSSGSSLVTLRNRYLMFYVPAWCLLPIVLLVSVVCDALQFPIFIRLILITVLLAFVIIKLYKWNKEQKNLPASC